MQELQARAKWDFYYNVGGTVAILASCAVPLGRILRIPLRLISRTSCFTIAGLSLDLYFMQQGLGDYRAGLDAFFSSSQSSYAMSTISDLDDAKRSLILNALILPASLIGSGAVIKDLSMLGKL